MARQEAAAKRLAEAQAANLHASSSPDRARDPSKGSHPCDASSDAYEARGAALVATSNDLWVKLSLTVCAAGPNGQPAGLTVEDCGKCAFCLDKPRFGGKGTKRQKCVHKSIISVGQVKTWASVRIVSKAHQEMIEEYSSQAPPEILLQTAKDGPIPLVWAFPRMRRARPLPPAFVLMYHSERHVTLDRSWLRRSLELRSYPKRLINSDHTAPLVTETEDGDAMMAPIRRRAPDPVCAPAKLQPSSVAAGADTRRCCVTEAATLVLVAEGLVDQATQLNSNLVQAGQHANSCLMTRTVESARPVGSVQVCTSLPTLTSLSMAGMDAIKSDVRIGRGHTGNHFLTSCFSAREFIDHRHDRHPPVAIVPLQHAMPPPDELVTASATVTRRPMLPSYHSCASRFQEVGKMPEVDTDSCNSDSDKEDEFENQKGTGWIRAMGRESKGEEQRETERLVSDDSEDVRAMIASGLKRTFSSIFPRLV